MPNVLGLDHYLSARCVGKLGIDNSNEEPNSIKFCIEQILRDEHDLCGNAMPTKLSPI